VGLAVGIALYLLPKTPGVILICLVLIFLLLALPIWNFWWIEKALWRRALALLALLGFLAFVGRVSWPKPEPLRTRQISIYGSAYDADYPPGSNVEGIPWGKGYSHVQLYLENLSDESVDDLNLSVSLVGVNIAEMRQTGTVPPKCEAFPDEQGVHPGPASITIIGKDGKRATIPGTTKITSAPAYRIHCPTLFAKSAVQFAVASVSGLPLPGPTRIPAMLAVRGSYRTGSSPTIIQPHNVQLGIVKHP